MKKIVKNIIIVLTLLILSVSTALLAYLHFGTPVDSDLSGQWTANLDMTDQAAVTAFIWLQDIEAVSISLEEVEACMRDLTIQVNLTLEQTTDGGGNFYCHVVPESYDACYQATYEAFAAAFKELLMERLRMAGYTGGLDEETVENLVSETFGMPTEDYLISCGPALLPSLEDIQAQYDGRGTYEAAEGVFTRQYEAGRPVATRVEGYIWKDSHLILSADSGADSMEFLSDHYPIIYTLQQSQDQ